MASIVFPAGYVRTRLAIAWGSFGTITPTVGPSFRSPTALFARCCAWSMGGGELGELADRAQDGAAVAAEASLMLSGSTSTLLPARLSVRVGDRGTPLAAPARPPTPLFGRLIPLFERLIPLG